MLGMLLKMKGQNYCFWLKKGETKVCGKSCLGEYCKIHLARIRNSSKVPVPCRGCGKGVQSDIHLCRACGRDRVLLRQKALERKARIDFNLVLEQLVSIRIPI